MKEQSIVIYLNDTSRRVTGAALLTEDTSENVVIVLRQATDRFGVPVTIISDNGPCFVNTGRYKKSSGISTPTTLEDKF